MRRDLPLQPFELDLATAILGMDTLWGGDVESASGMGRFIADCYFSGRGYPPAYSDTSATALRASGGLSAGTPDVDAARAYLARFDIGATLVRLRAAARAFAPLRASFVGALADSLEVMLALALERMGDGPPVEYARCVAASCATAPRWVDPAPLRAALAERLVAAGSEPSAGAEGLAEAVAGWRAQRLVDPAELAKLATETIEHLDELTLRHVVPHLPKRLRAVPRCNVEFLPIKDAWFSGSMNYLGRARGPKGEPRYEATYEINASLEISGPEFVGLVAHEVVPGHVMNAALIQHLFYVGRMGFEATVLTMNSRLATLFEGVANNALLLAHGVDRVQDLPDPDLGVGFLLSRLQDVAKNNASTLTWADGLAPEAVAARIQASCLLTEERAHKLAGAWAQHPLLGRMYMPAYEVGTQLVSKVLRRHGPAKTIPVLYGAQGLLDCATLTEVLPL